MKTWHIHINGIVQGVGFRPMVYQLASEMNLKGYVKNDSDGINIFFNAKRKDADYFFRTLIDNPPAQSKIISCFLKESVKNEFADFSILVEEDDDDKKNVLVPPDKATCTQCITELYDASNRRYRYPFITCTQCGPRYSIITQLPLERQDTSMHPFEMCPSCLDEYNDVLDHRFFSQTNSCDECGTHLFLTDNNDLNASGDSDKILSDLIKFLHAGKIVAVKGIGGFLLLCDANNTETIKLLRNRKHRPGKPFALLFPDIESIKDNFQLNSAEKKLLQSDASPIVLLYPKQKAFANIAVKDIAPGLNRLGIMLPYSPLLSLIATDFGKPLIATSANIAGSPIIYNDEDANDYLSCIADYIVTYDRDIVVPQDDSVVQVSKYFNQEIVLRRSRGYAPSFPHYKPKKENTVLSTGALLKSSFTLSVNGNVFVSQFLGSGENYESQLMYKDTLAHLLKLYEAEPAIILTDNHPDYFSHQYAKVLAESYSTKINFIQHHEAHFAAVLAENNLLHCEEPVLGVIWDGTGLGTDGNIWGGEFFKYENNEMLRCYHFDYFPAIAGDKLALEPRIAALCTTSDAWPEMINIIEKFTTDEWNNYQSLIANTKLFSSSAGRIFDAVASLLNICNKQTYEGEAALRLQCLAEVYVEKNGFNIMESYFQKGAHYYRIPTASLLQGILLDLKKNKNKEFIAAKFHYSLVCLIGIIAGHTDTRKICFSGGVFQNALLIDWIMHEYENKYQLYFHQHLSPNDENISFGQFVYYDNGIKSISKKEFTKAEWNSEASARIFNF